MSGPLGYGCQRNLKNVVARAFLGGLGALAVGVLIAAAGCSSSTTTPPPTSAATSTAPATTAAVAPDQLALATLNDIVQGDFSAATAHFDQTIQQKLPVEALQQGWTT